MSDNSDITTNYEGGGVIESRIAWRYLRDWNVGDECKRIMDCGESLYCCKMADREKDYCFSDCTLGHLESLCSDDELCNDKDGLFCCNGKC